MPLCSCKTECTCALSVNSDPIDNGLLLITGNGNPDQGGWKLRVVETPWDGTGDGAIVVTEGGSEGHSPTFVLKTQDTGTIALQVDAQGLRADALAVGPAGGGTPTGVVEDYLGDIAPPGYVMASGPNYAGYIPIDDAPGLYGLVGHSASGGVDPGNGTFLVPYLGERFLLGSGGPYGKGTIGGAATVALGINEMPNHGHGFSDPGHGHPGSTIATDAEAAHYHEAGTDRASHFVTVEEPVADADFKAVKEDGTGKISIPTHPADDATIDFSQGNRAATSNDGGHSHGGTATIASSGTGITFEAQGGGAAHNNMPPYYTVNRIIKT